MHRMEKPGNGDWKFISIKDYHAQGQGVGMIWFFAKLEPCK
jgi:hypothetical protein